MSRIYFVVRSAKIKKIYVIHSKTKMISGVQNYIYFHLQKNEELWFNHLMRSEQRNNVNVWKAVYRMSTEKVLLRALRD